MGYNKPSIYHRSYTWYLALSVQVGIIMLVGLCSVEFWTLGIMLMAELHSYEEIRLANVTKRHHSLQTDVSPLSLPQYKCISPSTGLRGKG